MNRLKEDGDRPSWARSLEFNLACIGYAVGMGNVWRFPYLCYSSGGGAFLIPYFIMLFLCGMPLLYMEMATGQVTRRGPVGALAQMCPFFIGAGAATVMLSFLLCTYYNVIMSWTLHYMFSVFTYPLPWSHCDNAWNTPRCWDGSVHNVSVHNVSIQIQQPLDTVSPSQEYYEHRVLQQTDGIGEPGAFRWELFAYLIAAWCITYLALWKGIRLTGKIVYFTATFPYIIILILLVRGLTLPGAMIGVRYYLQPNWVLLLTPKVWINAAAQNFNSIGIAFGSLIAFSSYNKPNNRIFKDVMSVCIVNSLTSIISGFAIFSIIGYIAQLQNRSVDDVVTSGPGLVFIVYPEAIATMPGSQFFSFLFFFMLLCLGVDSQFASVEVVVTTLQDHAGALTRFLHRRELLVLAVCVVAFLLGLPCITQGGIYYFAILDYYSSGISLMVIAFFEVIAITWFYGGRTLAKDVETLTGTRPFMFFIVCWILLAPLLILFIMVFNWIAYQPLKYGSYVFPKWAEGVGWFLASLSLVCLPIGMMWAAYQSTGSSSIKRLRNVFIAKSVPSRSYDFELDPAEKSPLPAADVEFKH